MLFYAPTWLQGSRLHHVQPPVLLPAARQSQRINDEPVEDLNILFFVFFIWKWQETFKKLHFLTFGPKQCFYLTHSARECFEKLAFKKKQKNATLKRFLSKARASCESKLTFSESYLYFFQNRIGFCALYSRGYMAGGFAHYNPHCCCQRLAWVKELMMSL